MAHGIKTEAIVLKKKQLLQKDILITLLTLERGKVSVIAKGIKNITSKRAPHIQTGNLLNVNLSDKGHVFYLQGTDLISAFSAIREHNEKTNRLYTFLFIIDRILPEAVEEPELYRQVKSFMIELSKTPEDINQLLRRYLQKTLMLLGYLQEEQSLSELIRMTEDIINEKVPWHAII